MLRHRNDAESQCSTEEKPRKHEERTLPEGVTPAERNGERHGVCGGRASSEFMSGFRHAATERETDPLLARTRVAGRNGGESLCRRALATSADATTCYQRKSLSVLTNCVEVRFLRRHRGRCGERSIGAQGNVRRSLNRHGDRVDVFDLRNSLIGDYADFARSFLNIRDARISARVSEELENGALWPDPLVQLNPSYEAGGSVSELIREGLLHPEAEKIFARKPAGTVGDFGHPLHLHRHQRDAIALARDGKNYVVTTGTGSGKSLTYIVPIVDHVLRTGSGKGIKAIIVYPMNALANSQEGELKKYVEHGYAPGKAPLTFARYTGQESEERKRQICDNPPDILLTNFVML